MLTCREKYKLLERFEVQIPEEQINLLEALDPEWAKFQAMLDEAAVRLEKYKDNFRYVTSQAMHCQVLLLYMTREN